MHSFLKTAFLITITCLSFFAIGQPSSDSIRARIAESVQKDSNLVWVYRDLFRSYYGTGKHEEMLQAADEGLQLAREINFLSGINYMVYYKATALEMLGRGKEAMPLFDEGIAVSYKLGDTLGTADYFVNKGAGNHNLGNLDEALKYYFQAYEIYGRYGVKTKISKTLNNIGIIYRAQKDYDRAEEIYLESIGIKKELNDSMGLAASYLNLGALYGVKGDPEEALHYLGESKKLYAILKDSAEVAGCDVSMGEILVNARRWSEARPPLEKAIGYFKRKPQRNYYSEALWLLGKVSLEENRPAEAERHLLEGKEKAMQFGQQEELLEILPNLAEASRQLGKYALADEAMLAAFVLQDSLRKDSKLALQEEMQARFDVLQREQAFEINALKLAQRTRQRNILVGSIFLLAMLGILAFWLMRQRLLSKRKIAELNAVLRGEEKERQRIAADLHDGLGGTLASLKSHFNQIEKPLDQDKLFDQTNRIIDRSYEEVRRISHNLAPQALGMAGLSEALEDLVIDLKSQGLKADLEVIGMDEAVLGDRATSLYRIVQELAHNVVKHAAAENIFIQLIQKEKLLTLMVEDDGKGFDYHEGMKEGGLGLGSVQSRVAFLQGDIEWDAVQGEGTTVSVRLPL